MRLTFEKLISIPKSFWVSFHYFPFKEAIKLPILVRYNTRLLVVGGLIKINKSERVKTGILSIGFGTVGIFDKKYERSIWEVKGCIELNGKTVFGHGSRLSVGKNGILTIGSHFNNTAAMTVVCQKHITFGDNVITSWNTLVMDTDWHPIMNVETNEVYPVSKDIVIGNNVWLCTRSVVLKGSVIPDGCIVGANSLCSKKYTLDNSLIAGNPAEIRKKNVTIYRNQNSTL